MSEKTIRKQSEKYLLLNYIDYLHDGNPITYLQGLSYDLDKVKNMMNNAFHDIEIDNKYKMTYHVSNVPVLFICIWRNKIQEIKKGINEIKKV